jgi:hypothetical protein
VNAVLQDAPHNHGHRYNPSPISLSPSSLPPSISSSSPHTQARELNASLDEQQQQLNKAKRAKTSGDDDETESTECASVGRSTLPLSAARLCAPPRLPARLSLTESAYNRARAVNQLGLSSAAAAGYMAALDISRSHSAAAAAAEASSPDAPGHVRAVAPGGALDLSREAAYNAALIAKLSGDVVRARAVTVAYLSYD